MENETKSYIPTTRSMILPLVWLVLQVAWVYIGTALIAVMIGRSL